MNDLRLFSKCHESGKDGLLSGGVDDKSFVGIEYSPNSVDVYFPVGFDLPKEEDGDEKSRECILTLLEAISLSKSINTNGVNLNDAFKEDSGFPLSSYLWLIKDYLSNGVYRSSERITKKRSEGKINWKKTLREAPYFSDGSPTYLNRYTEHATQVENIITEIHSLCLNEAIKHIGFLFGRFSLLETTINFENKDYLLFLLEETLTNTHEDRKQELLLNLINVLTGLDASSENSVARNYGVDGFHVVWEKVIQSLFGNKSAGNQIFASYRFGGGFNANPCNRASLRPDALLAKDGAIYILDAKYYRFGLDMIWTSAPSTTDVEKQIVYGEYFDCHHNFKKENIYNAFVIPYSKDTNEKREKYHENIEFVGYATVAWKNYKKDCVRPYYFVAIILVDTKFALKEWMNKNHSKAIKNMIGNILKIDELIKTYGDTGIPVMGEGGSL